MMVLTPTKTGDFLSDGTSRVGVVASVKLGEASRGVRLRSRAGGSRKVELRQADEILAISEAAAVARDTVDSIIRAAVAGAVPSHLAAIASGIIAANRAQSLLRGVELGEMAAGRAFPADCCIGVNDRIIHSVPSDLPLRDGDVLTVDVAVSLRGWCADVAQCAVVGRGDPSTHAMVAGCHEMLETAVSMIAPGVRWSRVAQAMQEVAVARSLGIVTGYAGHGVGRNLHEAPCAPSALERSFAEFDDFTLLPGMVLSVEPVVVRHPDGLSTVDAQGHAIGVKLVQLDDGWTMCTASGQPGCSIERTVAVTAGGCEILGEARASHSRGMDRPDCADAIR